MFNQLKYAAFAALLLSVTLPAVAQAEDAAAVPAITQDSSAVPTISTGPHKTHIVTSEAKEARKERFKARLAQLPPDQQKAIRAEIKEMHAQKQGMSKEERKAAKHAFEQKHPELFDAPVKVKTHHKLKPTDPVTTPVPTAQ